MLGSLGVVLLWLVPAMGADEGWEHPSYRPPTVRNAAQLVSNKSQRWCYPSGLEVYGEQARVDGMLFVGSVIGAGSADEADGQDGLAHVIEHLWFRSHTADGGGPQAVWTRQDQLGVWRNAYTDRDKTLYLTGGASASLEALLSLEAARLSEPLAGVDAATFDVEREVVRNELLRGYETSGRLGYDHVIAKLFPSDHPYAHTTIGTHETLNGLTLGAAQAFVEANYTPTRTSVHVVGDVPLGRLPKLVEATFPADLLVAPGGTVKTVPCSGSAARSATPPEPQETGITRIEASVDTPRAVTAWSVPGGLTPESGLAQSTMQLLEWSMEETVGREVSCFVLDYEDGSIAACETEVRGGGRRTLRRMKQGVRFIWRSPSWDWGKTYQNVRWIQTADFLDDNDYRWATSGFLPSEGMTFSHYTGETDHFSQRYNWIATPGRGDAEEYTAAWITRDRMTRTLILPDKAEATAPDVERPAALSSSLPIPAADGPADAETLAALARLPSVADRSETSLPSGLSVVALPGGGTNLTRVMMVLPGGSVAEDARGVHQVTGAFLKTIFGELGGRSFSRYSWYVGGEWYTRTDAEAMTLGVSGDTQNIATLFYMVRRRLEQAAVSFKNRGAWKGDQQERLKWLSGNAEVVAEWKRLDALVGDHPGRVDLNAAALAAWSKVGSGDAARWARDTIHPAGATLIVTGKVQAERVAALAERWFSDWSGDEDATRPLAKRHPLPDPPERAVIRVPRSVTSQHVVALSCQLDAASDRIGPVHELTTAWLDSKLRGALRADSGVTYSPGAYTREIRGGGVLLTLSARVQNDAPDEAADAMVALVTQAASGEIPEAELDTLKRAAALQKARRYRSTSDLASLLREDAVRGDAWERLEAWPEEAAAVTPASVGQQLQRCLGHEVITVAGP